MSKFFYTDFYNFLINIPSPPKWILKWMAIFLSIKKTFYLEMYEVEHNIRSLWKKKVSYRSYNLLYCINQHVSRQMIPFIKFDIEDEGQLKRKLKHISGGKCFIRAGWCRKYHMTRFVSLAKYTCSTWIVCSNGNRYINDTQKVS